MRDPIFVSVGISLVRLRAKIKRNKELVSAVG